MIQQNLVHIDHNFGWFLGDFDSNQEHRHYALQLSIPVKGKLIVSANGSKIESDVPLLIRSNIFHKIVSPDPQLLILINPASTIGHFWNQQIDEDISAFSQSPATELGELVLQHSDPTTLTERINRMIRSHDCFCASSTHKGDDRIDKALAYLEKNVERIVPADEVSTHCHVSTSRFLHLFRDQTGLTYRRAQLWSKLIHALPKIRQQSLTEVAYRAGFADSAHFSRTFRENFGFSPSEFIKISQFIQA